MNKANFFFSWNRLKKAICIAALTLAPLFSFAQQGNPVQVTNFAEVLTVMQTMYTNMMTFITTNFVISNNPALLIANSADDATKLELQNETAKNLHSNMMNNISFSLSDEKEKRDGILTMSLLKYSAEDDLPPLPPGMLGGIFAVFGNSPSLDAQGAANAAFSANTFLEPTKYTAAEKNAALMYLRLLESTAPINPIIRPANRFEIPFSPNVKESYSMFEVDKEGDFSLSKLHDFLKNNNDYLAYRLGYRSQIAVRTLGLNTLYRLFQERVAKDPNDKKSPSLLDLEKQQAVRRFTKEYNAQITVATPADVAKETLKVLAEIRYELFQMRQDNEQMLALQALSSLQSQGLGSQLAKQQAKEIGRLIYCWKNKDSSACSTTGAPSSPLPGVPS